MHIDDLNNNKYRDEIRTWIAIDEKTNIPTAFARIFIDNDIITLHQFVFFSKDSNYLASNNQIINEGIKYYSDTLKVTKSQKFDSLIKKGFDFTNFKLDFKKLEPAIKEMSIWHLPSYLFIEDKNGNNIISTFMMDPHSFKNEDKYFNYLANRKDFVENLCLLNENSNKKILELGRFIKFKGK